MRGRIAEQLDRPLDDIAYSDTLVNLGIDSLAGIELLYAIEQHCGVTFHVSELFLAQQTIAEMAALIAARARSAPIDASSDAYFGSPLFPRRTQALSVAQAGLWYLSQLDPTSSAYNLPFAIRVIGGLDKSTFVRALELVVARHEALRTRIVAVDGIPTRRVGTQPLFELDIVNGVDLTDRDVERRVHESAALPFNLERDAPLRARLFEREGDTIVLLCMHHTSGDLMSAAIILREFAHTYDALKAGTPPMLPDAIRGYAEFVSWEQQFLASDAGEASTTYWLDALQDSPELLDMSTSPSIGTDASDLGARCAFKVPAALVSAATQVAHSYGCTLQAFLLAVFQVLLYRYSGQNDFVVAVATSARSRAYWDHTVGYFTNMLPIRSPVDEETRFNSLLCHTRDRLLAALDHRHIPFARMVQLVSPTSRRGTLPLAQVAFFCDSAPGRSDEFLGACALGVAGATTTLGHLEITSFPVANSRVQFDLALRMAMVGGELLASFEYRSAAFSELRVSRMTAHFQTLLEAAVSTPAAPVATLALLASAERISLVGTPHALSTTHGRFLGIHDLITRQAANTPDARAVTSGTSTLTYRELEFAARHAAQWLAHRGVTAGQLVPIVATHSPEMIIAALAIMKLGAAYVPLDSTNPTARVQFLLHDLRASVVFADESASVALRSLADNSLEILTISDCVSRGAELAGAPLPTPQLTPDSIAYAIYTSGSTGQPKAALVSHRNVLNLFSDSQVEIVATDIVAGLASFGFDLSVYEIWAPLTVGASVTLVPRSLLLEPRAFCDFIRRESLSVLVLVPLVFSRLARDTPHAFRSLRQVLIGGDVIDVASVRAIFDAGPPTRFLGLYGPTETTVLCTIQELTPGVVGRGYVPLGAPIQNVSVYVLDHALQPVPFGVKGEVCIAGDAVATGYWNRDALTKEKFVTDPFCTAYRRRMYRTGDLGRFHEDGALEFLGRADNQVKIRGFRIELAEIEATLRQHPNVSDVIVAVRHTQRTDRTLVAYIALRNPGSGAEASLNRFLRARLPDHMIPGSFVILDSMPVSKNGKLDRNALSRITVPPPEMPSASIAPRNELEQQILDVWMSALDRHSIGVSDQFFDLGGDSLKLAEVAARVSLLLNQDVTPAFILEHRTVAGVAAAIANGETTSTPCCQQPKGDGGSSRAIAPDVRVESTSLLTLIATREIPRVDAAALAYFPSSLVRSSELREAFLDGGRDVPIVVGIDHLRIGRVALLLVPLEERELLTHSDRLLRGVRAAAALADSIGARAISLTGLLPSVSDYGRAFLDPANPLAAIHLTTGHATTAAAVVLNTDALLSAAGRSLSDETLGVVGVGSIGRSALMLLLEMLPHPRKLILCDVPAKSQQLDALMGTVRSSARFRGEIEVLFALPDLPLGIYEASVLLGATNVPDVLDIARVRPGTMIVDDSAPHCFNVAAAIQRHEECHDVLFAEGGVLALGDTVARLRFVPRGLSFDRLNNESPQFTPQHDLIGACVLSALLSANDHTIEPTLGTIPTLTACVEHYRRLLALSIRPAPLHVGRYFLRDDRIKQFRDEFARRPRA